MKYSGSRSYPHALVLFLLIPFLAVSAFAEQEGTPTEENAVEEDARPIPVAPVAPRATRSGDVHIPIVYAPPGCLDDRGISQFAMLEAYEEHFLTNTGRAYVTSQGPGARGDGKSLLVAEGDARDPMTVLRFMEGETPEAELVEAGVPVLVSTQEYMIQLPYRGHFDWLSIVERNARAQSRIPQLERVTADVFRYRQSDGRSVLLFDFGEETSREAVFSAAHSRIIRVDAPDDTVDLYNISRPLARGTRVRPVLVEKLAEDQGVIPPFLLHPGGVLSADDSAQRQQLCAQTLRDLNPMAVVPRAQELSFGPDALQELSREHRIRFVASNLFRSDDGSRPFRRFSILEMDGWTVAVIGVVDTDIMEGLDRNLRQAWTLTDPHEAVASARTELYAQLQRRPDLVVVLVASQRGSNFQNIAGLRDVDLVIGPFAGIDTTPVVQEVRPSKDALRSSTTSAPLLAVAGNRLAAGSIEVHFESNGENPSRRIESIKHRTIPILDDGLIDMEVHRSFLESTRAKLEDESRLVLLAPDSLPLDSEPVQWAYPEGLAPREQVALNTALVNRFLAHTLMDAFRADISLVQYAQVSRPLYTSIDRRMLHEIVGRRSLRLYRVQGRDLLRLEKEMARHPEIFVGGWDRSTGYVRGRAIANEDPYLVVIDEAILDSPAILAVFANARSYSRFDGDRGFFRPSRDGRYVMAHEVVEARSETVNLTNTLENRAAIRDRWFRFAIDELSLRVSSHANAGAQFAEVRQRQLHVPDHLSMAVRLRTSFLMENPTLSWRTYVNADVDHMRVDTPEFEVTRRDDLVLGTTVAIDRLGFRLGGNGGFPVVPFAGAEWDTEFFPIAVDPSRPDIVLPRQKVGRGVLGISARPGAWLREIRIGAGYHLDFSEDLYHAPMAVAGYDLQIPLPGRTAFESLVHAHYILPMEGASAADLALWLVASQRLTARVYRSLGFFAFFDARLASGAVEASREAGGSWTLGAGLDFSGVWSIR